MKGEKRFKFFVAVQSVRGLPFPIDMLRYDALAPARETDAHAIEASLRYEKRDDVVILAGWQSTKGWHPQRDRWVSYGWAVVGSSCTTEIYAFKRQHGIATDG